MGRPIFHIKCPEGVYSLSKAECEAVFKSLLFHSKMLQHAVRRCCINKLEIKKLENLADIMAVVKTAAFI